MVQFTLKKKTMASLAILEDHQAEVLSGGWKIVNIGSPAINSFNSTNNNTFLFSNFQIGSTAA
jgi:hypothetical protein